MMRSTVPALLGAVLLIGCSGAEKEVGVDTQSRGRESMVPKPGDIFISKLPDGRYTAVRVLRRSEKSSLVCTTEYLGRDLPKVEEPQLRTTVIQHRFSFKNQPAMVWLDGMPPGSFEFLGNITPTNTEADTGCDCYGGNWRESSGREAFLEWRWLHDRAAFEAEIQNERDERERSRGTPQKPKKMMGEDEFWSIIDRLHWENEGDDDKVLAPAIQALADKSTTLICEFAERLAFLLYQLDTKVHASNIGEYSYDPESDYVSADGFLYARCVVVANGKAFYHAALKDPTRMPKDLEFESLLYLAPRAYVLKTGEDFEYSTGCSYESFSNAAGWEE